MSALARSCVGVSLAALLLATPVLAVGPTAAVVYPSAWTGLCGEDVASVILRVDSDKALTAVTASFDMQIGDQPAGTVFSAKPPPGGGLVEIALPVATDLWGATMTVTVSDKGGRTATLVYEYSSANIQ